MPEYIHLVKGGGHHHHHHHHHHGVVRVILSPGCMGEIQSDKGGIQHNHYCIMNLIVTPSNHTPKMPAFLVAFSFTNNNIKGIHTAKDFSMSVNWHGSISSPQLPSNFFGSEYGRIVSFPNDMSVSYTVNGNSLPGYHQAYSYG